MQIERPQILADDLRHGHAQRGCKILFGHFPLPRGILEQGDDFLRQIARIAHLEERDGDIFVIGHFAEIGYVGRDDRQAVLTCQVGHAAGAGGRVVRHHHHAGGAKQLGNILFGDVAAKLDARAIVEAAGHRLHVARGGRVVGAGNDQPGLWQPFQNVGERFQQRFQPFVGTPFAKGQNAMLRIAPQ